MHSLHLNANPTSLPSNTVLPNNQDYCTIVTHEHNDLMRMRYRRLYINGATYFFTLVTYKRQKLFLDIKKAQLLELSITVINNRFPFKLEAFVIMPDHLHLMITLPNNEHDFSTRIRLIKSNFSKKCKTDLLPSARIDQTRASRNERQIWQRRFWEHQIRDEKDFNTHLDYIHYNPVKHGVVRSPKEWQYSSFHDCVANGLFDIDWGDDISDEYFEKIVNAE